MDDSHKSRILARAAVPSRLELLRRAGIAFEQIKGSDVYHVAGGAFVLNASIGNWRSADNQRIGYTCAGLIMAVQEADLRALIPVSARAVMIDPLSKHLSDPAAGRDSVAPADPDRAAKLTTSGCDAESAAGTPKPKLIWP